MPRPMMKATTAFAWWTGTSSGGGWMGAEGTGDAARMDEMDGVSDEFIRCAPLQSREPREGKTGKGWWTLVTTTTTNHETQ